MKLPKSPFVLGVLLLAVGIRPALGQARGATTPVSQPNPTPTPTPTLTPTPAPADLSARLWVDGDGIQESEQVRVWAVVENRGEQNADDVRFDAISLRGFEHVGNCWWDNTPACPAASDQPVQTASIGPHDQITRWAELRRTQKQPGKSVLFASLQWKDAAGQAQRHEMPVVVNTPIELAAVPGWSLGTYATILAAIVSAVFAWGSQRRSERQALLTANLSKNLQNAERHYLPLTSSASRVRREAKAVQDNPQADVATLVFFWLQFDRRMRELQQKIGGFYFQRRSGEKLVSGAADLFKLLEINERSAPGSALPPNRVAALVTRVSPKTNQGDFAAKLKANPGLMQDVQLLHGGLKAWIGTADNRSGQLALTSLELFMEVIGTEMNRPHARWYDEIVAANFTRLRTIASRLTLHAKELRDWAIDLENKMKALEQISPKPDAQIAQLSDYSGGLKECARLADRMVEVMGDYRREASYAERGKAWLTSRRELTRQSKLA